MLELLTTANLAAHLLAVNLASAGPLLCAWLHWHAARGDEVAGRVGRRLAAISLVALLVGLALGVTAILLVSMAGEARYLDALRQLPARKYAFAGAELAFSAVLYLLYLLLWNRWARRTVLHGLLAVLGTTNLLYHFPLLMAMLATISTRGNLAGRTIDRALYRQLLVDPEIVSRSLHVVLASLAVAGVALMASAWRASRPENDRDAALRLLSGGARVALAATALQLPLGVWVLLKLPPPSRDALMGRDGLAAGLLATSVILTFALLHALAAASLGTPTRGHVTASMLLMTVVILLMSATLRQARHVATARLDVARTSTSTLDAAKVVSSQ